MCVGWRGTVTHAPIPLARHMRHLNDVAPLLGRESLVRSSMYDETFRPDILYIGRDYRRVARLGVAGLTVIGSVESEVIARRRPRATTEAAGPPGTQPPCGRAC